MSENTIPPAMLEAATVANLLDTGLARIAELERELAKSPEGRE